VCDSKAADSGDSAGAPEEIEVSPEMIEAGREALFDAWDGYPEFPSSWDTQAELLASIYRGMSAKRYFARPRLRQKITDLSG
jgi:hypothetical protein